jgi:uncharacterized protein (TIGR02246 family)
MRMPAHTPEELPPLFAQAFSAHDLEAALALYEPEATLIAQPGQVVTGTEAIREALSGFLRHLLSRTSVSGGVERWPVILKGLREGRQC